MERFNKVQTAAFWGYLAYTSFPKSEYQITSKVARVRLSEAMDKMIKGEPQSISVLEEAKGIFGGHPITVCGGENVPKTGGFIVSSNHYNGGPLRGMWQSLIMAESVSRYIDEGRDRRYRVIFSNKKPFLDQPIEKTTELLSARLPEQLATPPITFLRSIQDGFNSSAKHIMHNFATAWDFILVEDDTREIARTIQDQNIVILYPTAHAERAMGPCVPEAGKLVGLLGKRYQTPVLPIGAWFDPKKGSYVVNIGAPKVYNPERGDRDFPQRYADSMGRDIAELLLPPLQGYYDPTHFRYSKNDFDLTHLSILN